MKKIFLAGAAVAVIAGSTAVYAQHRPWMHHHTSMNPEDRAAFADARIAVVKAGLKLTTDQEKMWPAVESAVRDFAKLRIDRANARMEERRKDGADGAKATETPDNPVARLQQRADNMATTAAALKKIAVAADPLYKTLDDGQKRRLAALTHMGGGFGGGEGWRQRGSRSGYDRGSFEGEGFGPRGFDHRGSGDRDDHGPGERFDRDAAPNAERL